MTREELAVMAQKMGLPLADFLDAARWLLRKSCPFCQMATNVLRRINELGEDKAEAYIKQILDLKAKGDTAALEKLKQEIR